MKTNSINNKFIYLFIFLFTFGLYANSISNGYSFDDNLITDNFQQKKSFADIFTSFSFVNKYKNISFAYRPVVLASFAIENLFVQNNPAVSHFVNVLLYAIICMLIYYLFSLLFPDINKFVFLATIIIFIVHPLHTEPVNNIKSRDELLTALFGVLTLIQYFKFLKNKKIISIVLVIIFSLLGIFSKLSFLVYLALIPAIYLIFTEKVKAKHLIFFGFLFIISFLSLRIAKHFLLNHDTFIRHYEFFENPLYQMPFLQRIPAGFHIPLYYFFLLFSPFKLSFYYGYNMIPIYNWSNLLPYVGILFFGLLVYLFFKTRRKYPFLSFGIAILLINSFAVSNIMILLPGIVAERFFFLGVLGFAMIVAYFIYRIFVKFNWIKEGRFRSSLIFVFLILIFSSPFIYKSYTRNQDWKSSESLVKADIPHLKNAAKANETMGAIYFSQFRKTHDRDYLIPAKKYYLQCVKVYPEYGAAWNNLAFINQFFGNWAKAEEDYLQAYKCNPKNAILLFNLAKFYQSQNKPQEAKQYYKEAIFVNPDVPDLIPYLKLFIVKENLIDEFIPYLKNIIHTNDNYMLQLLLIDLYNEKKDYNQMILQLNETYKKYPTEQLKQYKKEINRIFKK